MKTINAVQLWDLIESLAKDMPEKIAKRLYDDEDILAPGENVDPTHRLYCEAKGVAAEIVNSMPANTRIKFLGSTIPFDREKAMARVNAAATPYSGTRINVWWWARIYRAHHIALAAHGRPVANGERREIEDNIATIVRIFAMNLAENAIRNP